MYKVGLTGTKTWSNTAKIKQLLFKIKQQHPDTTIVGMGEKAGADKYIKRFALELGCTYKELNPPHTTQNLYSLMPESFHDKPFSVKGMYLRNKIFASTVDSCVLFDNSEGTDKVIKLMVDQLNKAGTPVVLVK